MFYKLNKNNKIVILTGAGISKASGISTYRDTDGVWQKYNPDIVGTPDGVQANKTIAWKFSQEVYENISNAKYNPAHKALVQLENFVNDGNFTLITQNIDGLHQQAGSRNVFEMHGNYKYMICDSARCNARIPMEQIIHNEEYVTCNKCGKMLRPSVIMFGEIPLYQTQIDAAINSLSIGDYFLAIGTSGTVYPAASFIKKAYKQGVFTFNINYDINKENYNNGMNIEIYDKKAEQFLPEFVNNLINGVQM